jgi:hypothetical protein
MSYPHARADVWKTDYRFVVMGRPVGKMIRLS